MIDDIKGKLIVSCQALSNEPLYGSQIMAKMAIAATQGGASAIRAQGIDDIKAIKQVCKLPIIGLIKKQYADSDIYITPTMKEVEALIECNCDMIALDATLRKRPNDEKLKELLLLIKKANIETMADISTVEEAIHAQEIGFDCVSTTLSGYTDYSTKSDGPNIELIKTLVNKLSIPVIAEGRIHLPNQLEEVFLAGSYAAVVGGAITRPLEITKRFIEKIPH